jgi:hypothetical protein
MVRFFSLDAAGSPLITKSLRFLLTHESAAILVHPQLVFAFPTAPDEFYFTLAKCNFVFRSSAICLP